MPYFSLFLKHAVICSNFNSPKYRTIYETGFLSRVETMKWHMLSMFSWRYSGNTP